MSMDSSEQRSAAVSQPHDRFGSGRSGRRRALRVFIVACVLWTLHYPLKMDRLYRAIPGDAVVGSYHRDLVRGWQKLAGHDALTRFLTDLGVEEAPEWRDDEGIFQTLYWLTGRHTVFGLRFEPGDTLSDVGIYGASYVGWKARPMEFLKLIRWIPGLGRLRVTPAGSYYLTFPRSRTMRELGLVLSLDLFEGVLVGVLSQDPDAVRELAVRVRHDYEPNTVFGEDSEPWVKPCPVNHRLWVSERATDWLDPTLGDWRFDVVSLEQERLAVTALGRPHTVEPWREQWAFGPVATACGGSVPGQAPFAALAVARPLLERLWPAEVPRLPAGGAGHPWANLAGAPYQGRLLGLALPALSVRLPWDARAPVDGWTRSAVDALGLSGKLGPVVLRPRKDASGRQQLLLDAAKMNIVGRPEDEDCIFLEADAGALMLGSHLGSHLRQGADSATAEPFRRVADAMVAQPEAMAWLWVDLPRAYEELRHAIAIYRLVARLSGSGNADVSDEVLGGALRALQAATALRQLTVTAVPRGETLELRVEAGSGLE